MYRKKQSSTHNNLILCHWSHLLQLLFRQFWRIGATLHRRRVNQVQKKRNHNQRHQTRNYRRLGPIGPPDRLLDRVESQIRAQWIRRHGRQEHRRRNHRRLKAREHQPRSEPLLGPVADVAAASDAE